jgi:hypothetical protein
VVKWSIRSVASDVRVSFWNNEQPWGLRVPVAGTLIAVGRPDGRCNALTGSESAVCLSVLQASSIQHLGVCCESITLGHNQFKLPLTANHITLPNGSRPKFLSEVMMATTVKDGASPGTILGLLEQLKWMVKKHKDAEKQRMSGGQGNLGMTNRRVKRFSSESDVGIQSDLLRASVPSLLNLLQGDKSMAGRRASKMVHIGSVGDRLAAMDENAETDDEEADPKFYGSRLRKLYPELTPVELMEKQVLLQRLYESRCASLHRLVSVVISHQSFVYTARFVRPPRVKQRVKQRCRRCSAAAAAQVSFMVLFHTMGKTVMDFWPRVSFGCLRYSMDRTQSIVRIATTAAPVTAMDVRALMLVHAKDMQRSHMLELIRRIARKWREWTRAQMLRRIRQSHQMTNEHLARAV